MSRARGLTTSPIPDGARTFPDRLRFHRSHACAFRRATARERQFALAGHSVASFYVAVMAALNELGIAVTIDETPNELPDPIRFSQDDQHASYDPDAVRRFLQILVNCDRVFKQFRTGFLGKASPVHFFWGSFDLAVTRFSGRTRAAPSRRRAEPARQRGAAKPIRTRSAAPASGRAAARSIIPRSIPMPIRSLRAFAPPRCAPMRPSSARRSANSSCPMTPCARLTIPTRRCWSSCKAPMRPRPIAAKWDRDALECAPGQPGVVRQV